MRFQKGNLIVQIIYKFHVYGLSIGTLGRRLSLSLKEPDTEDDFLHPLAVTIEPGLELLLHFLNLLL